MISGSTRTDIRRDFQYCHEQKKRLSMSTLLFFYRLVLRFRIMQFFRPALRNLIAGKTVNIELEFPDRTIYICFCDGHLSVRHQVEEASRVKVCFRSFSLAQNVIKSAMIGDQFWLSAMRDHRVNVVGDMSVILWFFSLCRHLPIRLK